MFDPNVTSITCGSLDFFDSAIDFDDLAFLNLIMCMQESDNALAAKMKEIRALNDLKRQITSEINYLNQALARSHAKADGKHQDDLVYVEGGLDNPTDPAEGRFKTSEEQAEYEKSMQKYKTKGKIVGYREVEMPWGQIAPVPIWEKATGEDIANANLYKRSEVEAKIEELRGRMDELNTSSSVLMIDLQRLMNKRNEATQLVSNLEAKSHQTAQAIIANLK